MAETSQPSPSQPKVAFFSGVGDLAYCQFCLDESKDRSKIDPLPYPPILIPTKPMCIMVEVPGHDKPMPRWQWHHMRACFKHARKILKTRKPKDVMPDLGETT